MSLEALTPEQIEKLATWSQNILTSPKTRTAALRLAKELDPNYQNPELDLADQIAASNKDRDVQIEKLEGKLKQEQLERKRSEKAIELKAKGYDIEIVEKVMTENHIGSYDAAMKLLDAERVLAPATSPSGGSTRMPDDMKEIQKNPNQWARDKAASILDEFKRGRA